MSIDYSDRTLPSLSISAPPKSTTEEIDGRPWDALPIIEFDLRELNVPPIEVTAGETRKVESPFVRQDFSDLTAKVMERATNIAQELFLNRTVIAVVPPAGGSLVSSLRDGLHRVASSIGSLTHGPGEFFASITAPDGVASFSLMLPGDPEVKLTSITLKENGRGVSLYATAEPNPDALPAHLTQEVTDIVVGGIEKEFIGYIEPVRLQDVVARAVANHESETLLGILAASNPMAWDTSGSKMVMEVGCYQIRIAPSMESTPCFYGSVSKDDDRVLLKFDIPKPLVRQKIRMILNAALDELPGVISKEMLEEHPSIWRIHRSTDFHVSADGAGYRVFGNGSVTVYGWDNNSWSREIPGVHSTLTDFATKRRLGLMNL